MSRLLPVGLIAGVLLLAGCPQPDQFHYERFNSDDMVEVRVESGAELGDPVTTDLTSTSGQLVVGAATVDPGLAPPGTDHFVSLDLGDDYEEEVARATVIVDSGSRGVEEFLLIQDSADHGYWYLTVQSLGDEGALRTDTFTFTLWVIEEGEADPDDEDELPEDTE